MSKRKWFYSAVLVAAIIFPYVAVNALDARHEEMVEQKRYEAAVREYLANVDKPVDVVDISAVSVWPAIETPVMDEAIPEPDENEKIEAALIAKATPVGQTKITHYCICKLCCGKDPDHPAYGITASGRKARPGVTVAVDPDVIPLGSDVLVDYGDGMIYSYIADDTGSGVKGAHIDICVADHQTAKNLGVKTATVWFIAPEK